MLTIQLSTGSEVADYHTAEDFAGQASPAMSMYLCSIAIKLISGINFDFTHAHGTCTYIDNE